MSSGTSSGTWGWNAGTLSGHKPMRGHAATTGTYGWNFGTSSGSMSPAGGPASQSYWGWNYQVIDQSKKLIPADARGYYSRFHWWVEDIHGNILTKDLVVSEASIVRALSGPSQISFKVSPYDQSVQLPNGQGPILFKPWGHLVHAVKEDLNGNEQIWASGIVQPSDVDPSSDVMTLKAEGFSKYLKGLPWLEDFNPLAVDPADIFNHIWTHVQSFPNGNLGVTVTNPDGSTPATTGTKILPGFSFQNQEFVQNFFAIFIRKTDRNDCFDYIDKLCRDTPIEFKEDARWNPDTGKIDKFIRIAYPFIGTIQEGIVFRLGENVKNQHQKIETEINWLSDITMKGYLPGQEIDAEIANPDPNRLRRVMDEADLHVDSNERAQAWAHRLLTRRQVPHYFEQLIVDPYAYAAPFMSYDVGDFVAVQGNMAWIGPVNLQHKILMIGWDEKQGSLQLNTMVDGAFNYDPIEYVQPGAAP